MESKEPKRALGLPEKDGRRGANGGSGSLNPNASDRSLEEEESMRGEAIVAGQMSGASPLGRRHTLGLSQQGRNIAG